MRNPKRQIAPWVIAVLLAMACGSLTERVTATHLAPAITASAWKPAAQRRVTALRPLRPAPGVEDSDVEPLVEAQQLRCADAWRARLRRRRGQMGVPRTPDDAFEHALLTMRLSLSAPEDARREVTAARQRWPASVELAWLAAIHCSEGAQCTAAWRHLAFLEPDNAAVWLLAMGTALRKHDRPGYQEALQRAAAARIFEPHHGMVFLHARAAIASLPMPASCLTPRALASMQKNFGRPPTAADWADFDAVNAEFAYGTTPGYGALKPCGARSHPSGTVRHDCIALLSLIATGNTLFDQKLAWHMLLDLSPGGADGVRYRERWRQVSWLTQEMWLHQGIPAGEITRQWTQGEVATVLARAMAEGHWPPPPGWEPDDAAVVRALSGSGPPPGP
jgi:hypothetical protein